MRYTYDIKDHNGKRIRVNLNEGSIRGTPNDNSIVVIEGDEMKEIENRIEKMLQRYIPKALKELEENREE